MDNQTDEKWLVEISNADTGTGVFLAEESVFFSNQTWSKIITANGNNESLRKTLVPNCYYLECVNLGLKEGVIAFKWIPEIIARYQVVENSAENGCGKVLCVRRCAKYGCVCNRGECK